MEKKRQKGVRMNQNQQDTLENAKKELLSDFNEARLQILRLSNSWELCKSAARSGDLIKWNWELDTIWRELSADATNKSIITDTRKYPNKIREINVLFAQCKNNPDKLYQVLDLKERILKRLQDEVGKGSKRSSTDEDDIDE